MNQFSYEHFFLVLTIVGITLSVVGSIAGIAFKRKPIVFLCVIAILGFVVAVTIQLTAFNKKQEDQRQAAAAKRSMQTEQRLRDTIIDEIRSNATHTRFTVDLIAARLNNATLAEVGTKLVSIQTTGADAFQEVIAFAKGNEDMWVLYANWLSSINDPQSAPSLSINLDGNGHYNAGLLLAYLLTSQGTRNDLLAVVADKKAWQVFPPDDVYLKNFSASSKHVRWVLFYDKSQVLVAFADAQAFTRELMVYHRLGRHKLVENVLNMANPLSALQEIFPSVQSGVFKATSPADLVRNMIDQKLSIAVATAEHGPFVVPLVGMIKIAVSEK